MQRIVRFGAFEADLRTGELRKHRLKVGLRRQSFEVLVSLLEHPGEVITREELRKRLWPADVFVDFDNNLNAAVARLRQALGDSAEHPRFIETLSTRGYRFIAPISEENSTLARVSAQPSVAVLPFTNIGRDPENEFFSDGLTEEIITALAQLEGVRVVSRTSAFYFQGSTKDLRSIGRKLKVDTVVEGSVRRTGERVRVITRLIRVADGCTVWSERFDRQLQDVFDLQDELVRAILQRLQVRLGNREHRRLVERETESPEAHALYLRGIHLGYRMTDVALRKSIECLKRAKSLDPTYARARGALGEMYVVRAIMGWISSGEALARAETEISAALDLDENLVTSHCARGMMLHWCAWNWPSSEKAYQRAISLGPGDSVSHVAYSQLLLFTGRLEESLREIRVALDLDPVSPLANWQLSWVLLGMRSYDHVIEQNLKTLELVPSYLPAYWHLGWAYGEKGMYPEAIQACQRGIDIARADVACDAILGWANAKAGFRGKALESVARVQQMGEGRPVPALYVAVVYVGLEEHDSALEWLETAYNQREPFLTSLKVAPVWDPLRSDSRFRSLLDRVGLG